MASPSVGFGLRGKNKAAQRVAQTQAAKLVTNVSMSTKKAIRKLVVRSIADGIAPRELAGMIRDVIGLTEGQASAAFNYRKQLVDGGVSQTRISQLMETFMARKLRERAMNIARWEVMDALNTAQLEEALDDQEEGKIGARATKEVIVTHNPRKPPCAEVCARLDGKKFKLNAVIANGRKNPPFHVRCRCALAINPGD